MSGVPAPLFARQVELRRALHRRPELAWREEETASRIEDALCELGLAPRRLADTGVVLDLPGAEDRPAVALRADTDALPLEEATGLPFASELPGVMHACGHDGHAAMLFGAAALLRDDPAPGPVRLIWQPAEEEGTGAPRLIEAGVLDGVEAIFGGHLDPRWPTGTLVVTEGPVGASTDEFRLVLRGRGGHGARPHEACDALLAGAALVTALQSVVAREVDPASAAVLTVGRFRAGSAPNVIAGEAVLEGTVRALEASVRERVLSALRRVAEGAAAAHGATVRYEALPGTPPVVNDPDLTRVAREAARAVVSDDGLRRLERANMGGEDFACYLERVPGCYIRFGARPASGPAPAHSSAFDFDEEALAVGAAWFAEVARRASAKRPAAGPSRSSSA